MLIGDREGDTLVGSSDADTFVLLENETTSSDNLEVIQDFHPFLETYDNLYKSLIICSIPASFWQRRRYPVHKLSRSN